MANPPGEQNNKAEIGANNAETIVLYKVAVTLRRRRQGRSAANSLLAQGRITVPVFTMRQAVVAAMAAIALNLAPNAQARGGFDGAWSVVISGNSGTCDGLSYQYDLQIVNGALRYSGGDASISGAVAPSGSVNVRVSSGDNSAAGSGRLAGRSGRGSFRGRSSTGLCAGTWSATRTGG
jgi:hypothetical protein